MLSFSFAVHHGKSHQLTKVPYTNWVINQRHAATQLHPGAVSTASHGRFDFDSALGSMNTRVANSADSWLALVGSATAVLGPSRGHIPDLGAFRIAYMHLTPAHLWLY